MATQVARREPWPAARRYKIRFPDAASFAAASSLETGDLPIEVSNAKRLFFTLSVPAAHTGDAALERVLDQRLEFFATSYGAELIEDERWDLDTPPLSSPEGDSGGPSLDDVLETIGAPQVWASGNRGQGATIAVVDSGISGNRPEIAPRRRRGAWQPAGLQTWADPAGHGTLCAVIAAGSRKDGGRFDGVAPEAGVIACRTRFFDSELSAIYDYLTKLLASDPGLRLVVTNSFGRRHDLPPPAATESDFLPALEDILEAGAAVLFSAGNNHQLAGGHPEHCHPSTIWGYKLRHDLLTVGACDLEGRLWHYSSRGPGMQNGPHPKPDLVAPVPRDGLTAYGDEEGQTRADDSRGVTTSVQLGRKSPVTENPEDAI